MFYIASPIKHNSRSPLLQSAQKTYFIPAVFAITLSRLLREYKQEQLSFFFLFPVHGLHYFQGHF